MAIKGVLDRINDRPMRRLGVSRRELFETIERPALKPLPGIVTLRCFYFETAEILETHGQ